MSAEQSLEQFPSGAGLVYRPAEYGLEWGAYGLEWGAYGLEWGAYGLEWGAYGLEWGAYGLSTAQQAYNEAGHNPSLFDFRRTPSTDTRPAPNVDISCLDVGVMFDVCLPEDQARLQKTGGQRVGQQRVGQQRVGQQRVGQQRVGQQKSGGDFADVVPLQGDWVALFLGDANGQGPAAALAVPQALYSLRQLLRETAGTSGIPSSGFVRDPAHTLKRLNRHLCGPALPAACASVSLSLAVLNTQTGQTLCACAGSEPPLILRAHGQIETISASRVALGVEADRSYRSVDLLLGKGDALLLATDGITKAQKTGNGTKSTLRYEGLTGLALEAFQGGGSPGRMARAVLNGARAFAGGSFHDHASVLVAARR